MVGPAHVLVGLSNDKISQTGINRAHVGVCGARLGTPTGELYLSISSVQRS